MNLAILFSGFILLTGSLSAAEVEERTWWILGDTPTKIWHHPYQASLRLEGNHVCSGAIISQYHILTSAICAKEFLDDADQPKFSSASVHTGTHYKHRTKSEHLIADVYVHPLYRGEENGYQNNVAVIQLQKPISLSKNEQVAKLPDSEVEVDQIAITTGWRDYTKMLLKARMVILSKIKCHELLNRDIYPGQFCAANKKGLYKYQGEAGSPLVVDNVVVGITSCVDSKCEHTSPDMYTDVYAHKEYIKCILTGKLCEFNEGPLSPQTTTTTGPFTTNPVDPTLGYDPDHPPIDERFNDDDCDD